MSPNSTTVSTTGTISSTSTGAFTLDTGSAGYVRIYTNSSTSLSGPVPASGLKASVTGTGSLSTSITASSVSIAGTGSIVPATGTVTAAGPIASVSSNIVTINAGSTGYVHVSVGSGTKQFGSPPAAGRYAVVTGSGSLSSSIAATTIAVYASAPGTVTVSGPVAASTTYGFTISSGSAGYVPVAISASTAMHGSLAVGSTASVTGIGSTANAIAATSVTAGGSSGSGGSSGGSTAPAHVDTADYLGTPWGTTGVSAASAKPFLTWAETGVSNANAFSAAGLKTMAYVDPNRTQPGGPMYNTDETTYAHDCSNHRVTDLYAKSVTQYVMNPSSSSMRNLFTSYVNNLAHQAHYDALFEDDAGALSAFAPYDPFSAMPCSYSDGTWIQDEVGLNSVSPIPVIINGLSGLNGDGVSLGVGIMAGSSVMGGTYEQCYTSTSQPKQDAWVWADIENTELQIIGKGKTFQCMGTDTNSASSSTDARVYAYASFLLTYDPARTIYRSEFATPSGLHVMPETGLVALDPTTGTPSSIASLKQSGGTYARQYANCYYRGTSVGACAVVVNSDRTSHPFPFTQYHHTLVLSGSGVLDGGSVSFSGGAPPSTIGADEAAIVFP